jgi:hypothetical protein
VGIPSAIVVDTRTGKIIDSAADLVLRKNPTLSELEVIVGKWQKSKSASSSWMRWRFSVLTWFYVSRHRLSMFINKIVLRPLRQVVNFIQSKVSSARCGARPPKLQPEPKADEAKQVIPSLPQATRSERRLSVHEQVEILKSAPLNDSAVDLTTAKENSNVPKDSHVQASESLLAPAT